MIAQCSTELETVGESVFRFYESVLVKWLARLHDKSDALEKVLAAVTDDRAKGNAGEAEHDIKPPAIETGAAGSTIKPDEDKRNGPQWNEKSHEFSIDGVVVHAYKRKAKNQFLVLEAFEAEGWATVIDTPIDDSKQRTQTLKELNKLAQGKIKFHGDGTGERLKWERPSRKQQKRPAD